MARKNKKRREKKKQSPPSLKSCTTESAALLFLSLFLFFFYCCTVQTVQATLRDPPPAYDWLAAPAAVNCVCGTLNASIMPRSAVTFRANAAGFTFSRSFKDRVQLEPGTLLLLGQEEAEEEGGR